MKKALKKEIILFKIKSQQMNKADNL